MFLDPYYTEHDDAVCISSEQASQFAKQECADFNPIHDPGAKRFCVPGDLLFSIALAKFGISQTMRFKFMGMVGENTMLRVFSLDPSRSRLAITDENDKRLLEIDRIGEKSRSPELIEALIKNYIVFSGQNFPALLMPLMKKHQVMFNPARPLVMYDSMSFELDTLELDELQVALDEACLEVEGKRAEEFLHFKILNDGQVVGRGVKTAVLGGLKPYDHDVITRFAEEYEKRRAAFLQP
jgi:hypothetical protein